MKGVVVTTSKYTKDFLNDCLESIKEIEYPILLVSNDGWTPDATKVKFKYPERVKVSLVPYNGWEIEGIRQGAYNFDEFVHIMDTTVIKDISLFDKVFEVEGNVVFTKGNFHYMGKFVSKELPNLPIVRDKVTAIMLETIWLDKYTEFEPDLPVHSLVWEDKFGQNRMRIENEYMVKWKGTCWISPEQLAELTEQEKEKLNKDKSK